ncbi:MAG: orotidine-5-phosphate decarboxylase [Solirubrobacterales bacterium]|nr:orotidine-5-phosphate decarboxylase [Solirubrobacterales bacterium]
MSPAPFSDRLAALAVERRSQLCLGLDPTGEDAGAAIDECERLIDLAGASCIAAKPQLACFERFGGAGWEALEHTVARARRAGLLVVADAKRGDVPHTAAVYARALLGPGGLEADATTVNPLLGGDAIEPFIAEAEACGAGVFALVLTSNPGAADLLELAVADGTVSERIAALVAERSSRLVGAGGLSGLGAVVGATNPPARIARMRELMPDAIFLMPGVGAQGADTSGLAAAIADHPASILVPVSRSIAGADDPAQAAEALRAELWSLSGA